jgi:hypothetical protein
MTKAQVSALDLFGRANAARFDERGFALFHAREDIVTRHDVEAVPTDTGYQEAVSRSAAPACGR